MDYTELSNDVINDLVLEAFKDEGEQAGIKWWDSFSPTTDASDAWPLIDGFEVGLLPSYDNEWTASVNINLDETGHYIDDIVRQDYNHQTQHRNGLRAAMITLLKAREANHV